ncbi:hypothetical protein GJAV_G00032230 [Gymnothorax javanicus]|nr:hypothetical protein GJAV_G00032230 [Gymnothorax javanicus]
MADQGGSQKLVVVERILVWRDYLAFVLLPAFRKWLTLGRCLYPASSNSDFPTLNPSCFSLTISCLWTVFRSDCPAQPFMFTTCETCEPALMS